MSSLGCDIGYGFLHRIPSRPGDTKAHNQTDESRLQTPNQAPIMQSTSLQSLNKYPAESDAGNFVTPAEPVTVVPKQSIKQQPSPRAALGPIPLPDYSGRVAPPND